MTCESCGAAFAYDDQQFCQECGAGRIEIERYTTLRSVSLGCRVLGYLVGAASVVGPMLYLFGRLDRADSKVELLSRAALAVVAGLSWAVTLLMEGELITLLIDIEGNTRRGKTPAGLGK